MEKLFFLPNKKRGVTLVELLVVIFIFSVVILIISTSFVQSFMANRLHSTSTKDINRELTAATNLIAQKMTNANAEVTVGTDTIYGFKKLGTAPSQILAIASSKPVTQCTFLGVRDEALYSKQTDCSGSIPNLTDLDQKIVLGNVKITSFTLDGYDFVSGSTAAPYVKVLITGEDRRTNAKVTLNEIYSLNYPYEKSW